MLPQAKSTVALVHENLKDCVKCEEKRNLPEIEVRVDFNKTNTPYISPTLSSD